MLSVDARKNQVAALLYNEPTDDSEEVQVRLLDSNICFAGMLALERVKQGECKAEQLYKAIHCLFVHNGSTDLAELPAKHNWRALQSWFQRWTPKWRDLLRWIQSQGKEERLMNHLQSTEHVQKCQTILATVVESRLEKRVQEVQEPQPAAVVNVGYQEQIDQLRYRVSELEKSVRTEELNHVIAVQHDLTQTREAAQIT